MTPSTSTTYASLALLAITSAPYASTFSPNQAYSKIYQSSTKLNYRSIYHGPDIEPPTDMEKLGADATKMAKDKIYQYGPGDFTQYLDNDQRPDLFDGGDSEMGLFGDGNTGLQRFGCDVTPHLARTSSAKSDEGILSTSMSYADELLEQNPGMDTVRAHQLKNWANQREISMTNSYMNNMYQEHQELDQYVGYEHGDDETSFTNANEVQVRDDAINGGTISLSAPVNTGVAIHEIMLKNLYMGYAKFRATFVGDDSGEWTITPNDGFLKSSEETQFIVRYTPHTSGVSRAQLVIETEDFQMVYNVVGSTGEYEF
jgi:hypothetical protein